MHPVDSLEVIFLVKDFTTNRDGPEIEVDRRIVDILPGGTADVVGEWLVPPNGEKFCVVIRFAPEGYTNPQSGLSESNSSNNSAQSNYVKLVSSTASPSSREQALVTVTNPLAEDVVYMLVMSQSNPNYRSCLEREWFRLGPNESTVVNVMSEFVGHSEWDELRLEPNLIDVEGHFRPLESPYDYAVADGGLTLEIVEGLRTEFDSISLEGVGFEGSHLRGKVFVTQTGVPAPNGPVIVTFRTPLGPVTTTTQLTGGEFIEMTSPPNWTEVYARYVAPDGYAGTTSEVIVRTAP